MSCCYQSIFRLGALAFAFVTTLVGFADATVLGPTPYYSKSDSPFPVAGRNPSFFLEDFEPPANLPPGGLIIGKFSPPGATRDWGGIQAGYSLGVDDPIDGSGRNAWSGSLVPRVFTGTESELDMFSVHFDAQTLGFFPTAVGFVVTHGTADHAGFSIYNPAGDRKDFQLPSFDLGSTRDGGGEFVGVVDLAGISRIDILQTVIYGVTSGDENLLLDHFQYGLYVPEPSSLSLICVATAVATATLCARSPSVAAY